MSENRRPPRLIRNQQIGDSLGNPELCTVVFRMVSGPDLVAPMSPERAEEVLRELSATWRREQFNTFTLRNPATGHRTMVNPAHVVTVEIQ